MPNTIMTNNTPILLPRAASSNRDMTYESLDLLYHQKEAGVFGDHMAFIVSCSRSSQPKDNDPLGVLHKLEVTTAPNFAQATLQVTHEVVPGLKACSQIITANEWLKVACFDNGAVMPVKNFGPKKTFHSDVRGSLVHHRGQVTCLATNSPATKLSSGCTSGSITLYRIDVEEVSFLTRTDHTGGSTITGLSFVPAILNSGTSDGPAHVEDNILLYSTLNGHIGTIDTRCGLAEAVVGNPIITTEPRSNITAMLCPRSKPGNIAYFAGSQGEIFAYDLRQLGNRVIDEKSTDGGCIRRLKEINFNGRTFIAHTNASNSLRILDMDTLKPSALWKCDRMPEGKIQDLVQVENRIVTCGEKLSIGCWEWDPESV